MERTRITVRQLAKALDHSLLRPELTVAEVREGCRLARRFDVVSVCVRPSDVAVAGDELAGSDVLVTTTIGFPHGVATTAAKVAEARDALALGAVELDMVQHVGRLRSGDSAYVEQDIRAVVEEAHRARAVVKVILENAYLTDEEKVLACRLAEAAGADFVKTSSGFAPGGATVADLALMRRTCSPRVRIKAAGGVSTLDGALAVIAVGADRIGMRATQAVLEAAAERAGASGLLELPAPAGTASPR